MQRFPTLTQTYLNNIRLFLIKNLICELIDLLLFYNNKVEYNSMTSYLEGEVDLVLKQFSYKDVRLNKISNKPLAYVKNILDISNIHVHVVTKRVYFDI